MHKFWDNVVESSRNVSETTPRPMRAWKSCWKHINFAMYLAQFLQNNIYSSYHQKPPALNDHLI